MFQNSAEIACNVENFLKIYYNVVDCSNSLQFFSLVRDPCKLH